MVIFFHLEDVFTGPNSFENKNRYLYVHHDLSEIFFFFEIMIKVSYQGYNNATKFFISISLGRGKKKLTKACFFLKWRTLLTDHQLKPTKKMDGDVKRKENSCEERKSSTLYSKSDLGSPIVFSKASLFLPIKCSFKGKIV